MLTEGVVVGKFTLTARIGAGASGEVWKAHDTVLGRWVALKFLKGGDEDEVARFQREAQVAGRLSHPNIAAIHEVGETDGRRYIAMQLVEGRTLRGWPVRERRRAVAMIRDAARAVAYAHAQGVVHRDLKPENVMVSGEHVYVMDFGLARPAAGAGVSVSGAILGTPGYMPPEQARGEKADARSDVYGLGATLYCLLTGGPPFDGPSVYEILRKVQEDEPRSPGTDSDLDAIVLRCLEKDRARRYETAAHLAEDLSRWLAGEPVLARVPSMAYRVRKKIAKRKAVAVSVVALSSVAILLAVLVPRIVHERRVVTLWSRVSPLITEAEVAARVGEVEHARRKLDEAIALCEPSGDLAEARYFLGRLRRARGDVEGARRELDRALEMVPSLSEARQERGLLLVGLYRERLMATPVTTDTGGERHRWTLREIRAREAADPVLAELGRQAAADLEAPVAENSYVRPDEVLYGRAELDRLRGDYDAAERGLRAILERNPMHAGACLALAQTLWERDDPAAALKLADEAAERHRGDADAHFLRGLILRFQRRDTQAIEAFSRSLQVRERPMVLHHRGMALEEKGDIDGAVRDYDRAIELDRSAYYALNSRGWCRRKSGQLDLALADVNDAIVANPRYAMAYCTRAMVHADAGRIDDAYADFDRAIAIEPGYIVIYVNRAYVRGGRGDLDGVIADCTKAIELNAGNVVARMNRAQAYRQKGQFARAAEDYGAIIAMQPVATEPRVARASLRAAMGDVEGALADAEAAVRNDDRSADAWYTRGTIRVQRGEKAEAIADLEKALARAPRDWPGTESARQLLEDLRRR